MPTLSEARRWYAGADPIHDYDHIVRVYRLAERLAQAEGADLGIVRAAAILHDAEGTTPGSAERVTHHHSSAEFAAGVLKAEGWPAERIEAVQHCIRAHRFRDTREPPATIEAKIIFDADKLDVLGAIGACRTAAYAAMDRQPFFALPSERFIRTGEKEPGEPHSSYHEFLFKLSKIKARLFTPAARTLAEERHAYLQAFFERLQAEWEGEL